MLSSIKKLFLISRPVSWPNTAYPFAAAYIVTGGTIDAVFVASTLYFLVFYNLLMYGINDVFDYESDIRNPRKGGIEGAVEQKAFHSTILWSAILTNIPFLALMVASGTVASNITLAIIIFFVVAYSAVHLRFKEIPILDSITSSIHFVGPMVYGFALTGFSPAYIPYVVAFFLWGAASHAFGAVQDIIPDREGKLSSIATALGARTTVWRVFLLYLTASLIIIMQGWPAAIVGVAGLIYVANVMPYLRITDKTSGTANKGWRRFIWLNLFAGFVITMVLIYQFGFAG